MNLYPYQQEGARWLARKGRGMLCDVMGMGKSVQAITAARIVQPRETIVLCPASAVPNWENEWAKWEGPANVRFLSYSSLIRRDWKSWNPDLVIPDEFHYLKSPSAKRTRAGWGLCREAKYVFALSGTPMPNSPVELWPIFKYLWPSTLAELGIRTGRQWMQRFCKCRPTPYGPKPYAVNDGATLRKILSRVMLRRTLDDVGLDLPPLRVDLVRLPKDRRMTEALADYHAEEEADESMYSTMRRHLGVAKAPSIARLIVEELDNRAYPAVIVLYYHREVGDMLYRAFEDAGYYAAGFDGSTPQSRRQVEIDRFQTDPKCRVFLAQQTAAGIAINLTAASELVLVEPDWTPAVNKQAIKRCHRIGQDKPCRARVFCVAGTMDQSIMETIVRKTRMLEEVGLK